MNEGFEKKVTVIDEWEAGSEHFRLENWGAGPSHLMVSQDGVTKWREETKCYEWGLVTAHIAQLKADKAEAMAILGKLIDNRREPDKVNAIIMREAKPLVIDYLSEHKEQSDD